MRGKAVIKGTRITVEQILEDLTHDNAIDEILNGYPHLNKEQLNAALTFVARSIRGDEFTKNSMQNSILIFPSKHSDISLPDGGCIECPVSCLTGKKYYIYKMFQHSTRIFQADAPRN